MTSRVVLLVLVAIFASPALGSDGTPVCKASEFWCTYKDFLIPACAGVCFFVLLGLGVAVCLRQKKLRAQKESDGKVEPVAANLGAISLSVQPRNYLHTFSGYSRVKSPVAQKKNENKYEFIIEQGVNILQNLKDLGASLDLNETGLFRVPGSTIEIQQLIDQINNHTKVDFSKVDSSIRCGVIKALLKPLQILSGVNLNQALDAVIADLKTQQKREALEWLLELCCDIVDNPGNKMGPSTLAMVLVPSLDPENYVAQISSISMFLTKAIETVGEKRRANAYAAPPPPYPKNLVFYYQ